MTGDAATSRIALQRIQEAASSFSIMDAVMYRSGHEDDEAAVQKPAGNSDDGRILQAPSQNGDAPNQSIETGKKIEAGQKEFDQQLEGILGKDGFAKLKDYERTIGDRMQLQQYKQAFSASGTALEDSQANGLLAIMKDERLKETPSPFEPGNKDPGAAMKAMQSDEVLDKLMASQEALGRRVLDRARTVLSPDQMTQFEQIQKQQLEMQKMGMKMGREMMKSGTTKTPPPPQPPQAVDAVAK